MCEPKLQHHVFHYRVVKVSPANPRDAAAADTHLPVHPLDRLWLLQTVQAVGRVKSCHHRHTSLCVPVFAASPVPPGKSARKPPLTQCCLERTSRRQGEGRKLTVKSSITVCCASRHTARCCTGPATRPAVELHTPTTSASQDLSAAAAAHQMSTALDVVACRIHPRPKQAQQRSVPSELN